MMTYITCNKHMLNKIIIIIIIIIIKSLLKVSLSMDKHITDR